MSGIKISKNRKLNIVMVSLVSILVSIPFFVPSKSVSAGEPTMIQDSTVTYQKDIAPLIKKSCSPCHFPETGKKEPLDTYDATKDYADDILERVQLPKETKKFMPFKSKKEPWSAEEIKLFKTWIDLDMPK